MKVQNHTTAIEKALHLDEGSVKHEGNFLFSGKLNGCKVMICTEPVDEMQNEISIYSMEIGEAEQEELKPADAKDAIIEITADTRSYDCWVQGKINLANGNAFEFCAKVYDEGSQYGINKGRVSKLHIRLGRMTIVNYDRGRAVARTVTVRTFRGRWRRLSPSNLRIQAITPAEAGAKG